MSNDTNTQNTPTASTIVCRCYCGQDTIGKDSFFRPGHDARMVSAMVQDLVYGDLGYANRALALELDPRNDIQANMDAMQAAIGRVYSSPLATKFEAAAHNAWAKSMKRTEAQIKKAQARAAADAKAAEKAARKAAKAAKVTVIEDPTPAQVAKVTVIEDPTPAQVAEADASDLVTGTVKIGRWTYPAYKDADGTVQRNTNREGSGQWITTDAEFIA